MNEVLPCAPTVAGADSRWHLKKVDVLRGLAVLGVVCCHYLPAITNPHEPEWAGCWLNLKAGHGLRLWTYPIGLGWTGVSLFFVISGFCIHSSFLKYELGGGLWSGFLPSFLQRRFWRIYPAFLVAFGAFYLLAIRHGLLKDPSFSLWPHVLLVDNLSAQWLESLKSINLAFWSLAVEVQFYLLFPIILLLRARVGLQRCLWGSAFVSAVCSALAIHFQDWNEAPSFFLWHFTLILFVDWVLGAVLAEAYFSGRRLFRLSAVQIAAFGLLASAVNLNKITAACLGFTAFSVWWAMVMDCYLANSNTCNWLERLLVPIGLCSYSIYLWHEPLLGRLLYRMAGTIHSPVKAVLLFPPVLATVLAVGYASYRLIELPGIEAGKWLQKWLVFPSRNPVPRQSRLDLS